MFKASSCVVSIFIAFVFVFVELNKCNNIKTHGDLLLLRLEFWNYCFFETMLSCKKSVSYSEKT